MDNRIYIDIKCSRGDAPVIDRLIESEKLDTISETYTREHEKLWSIRYFFSCFRDSMCYDRLRIRVFFNEGDKIGLSLLTSVKDVLRDKVFQVEFKSDLREYIERLNGDIGSLALLDHEAIDVSCMDQAFKECTDEYGSMIGEEVCL